MKKAYIAPKMTDEAVDVNCYLNLQSNGTTSNGQVTSADAPFADFEEEDLNFNEEIKF